MQATKYGKVQRNNIPEILPNGSEEEVISTIYLHSEILKLFSLLLPTNCFLRLMMTVCIFILFLTNIQGPNTEEVDDGWSTTIISDDLLEWLHVQRFIF